MQSERFHIKSNYHSTTDNMIDSNNNNKVNFVVKFFRNNKNLSETEKIIFLLIKKFNAIQGQKYICGCVGCPNKNYEK